MKRSTLIQVTIGVLLASAGLWFFFKGVDTKVLAYHLRQSNPLALVVAGLLAIFSLWLRAKRWAIILPDSTTAHKRGLWSITSIAFMVNNILPARIGEVVRVVLLWKKNGFSGPVSIGSVIVERIIDTFTIAAMFGIATLLLPDIYTKEIHLPLHLPTLSGSFHQIAILVLTGCFFSGLIALLYGIMPNRIHGFLKVIMLILPKKMSVILKKIGKEILNSIDWLRSLRKIGLIVVLSIATIGCYPLMIFIIIGDVNFVAISKAVFVQGFAVIGAAIPFTPGFVGTLHALMLQGLLFLGIERTHGISITILYHATSYTVTTFLGLYFFFKGGLHFKEITKPLPKNSVE